MIAYSRERLHTSWLSGSKFAVSRREACGGPDYEVWDCEIPGPKPLMAVLLPRQVNPDERGEGMAACSQTKLESCCAIQSVDLKKVFVYDILSEFLVLTVELPEWNSLYLSETHSS
ncbi:hypothetical protein Pelo_5118 [Pelomyxa schiedti]|nr:hypothetical protein Pelo_5118 [Pelomyxa schiedti]